MIRKHKLSAFIPVQNVEPMIRQCLDSITWVDEVFIVDAFSTDRTVEICKEYPNVKIVQHEYENSGAQRSWGMPQVTHNWVFIIDSDERCTPALRREIEKILSQGEIQYDGFLVSLKTLFFGRLQNHDRYLGYRGMRLVHRETARNYTLRSVHSTLDVKHRSMIKAKDAYIIHEPIRDFKNHIYKMTRYAEWAATDMYNKGQRINLLHLIFRPFYKFFNHYFFKLGFLDGLNGLVLCTLAGISIFLKYYALMHLQYNALKTNESKTSN